MSMTTREELTPWQLEVVEAPVGRRVFLEGVAGTGKTTAGIARLEHLLRGGTPADCLLVLVPQRTLSQPYSEALRSPQLPAGGQVATGTLGGIARRMVDLFWPLVAEEAGFADPAKRPTFLTLETAQYYMARVVDPLVEQQGYFQSITIDRNRLYSQIVDNLNKSAVVGFSPSEIADRLKDAWMGTQSQARVYDEAQECAMRFRQHCLDHNLLDFSLQMAVFAEYLWEEPLCRDYLVSTYRHLLIDNVEEDTPIAHDVLYSWLGQAESALVIFDSEAGYRSFLGADTLSAIGLRDLCDESRLFSQSFVMSPPVFGLGRALAGAFDAQRQGLAELPLATRGTLPGLESHRVRALEDSWVLDQGSPHATDIRSALRIESHRYHPEMLDWVADEARALVHGHGVAPGEIVILAPFLTDALRFSLANRLDERGIPVRSHRPSRALRDEVATETLLTFAALAHPQWGFQPSRYDLAYALMHAIDDLDLVRAQLLAAIVYRHAPPSSSLAPFDEINPSMQERITFVLGGRYEALRTWLAAYTGRPPSPLDHFLARLFGEVLSQPGFGFHRDVDSGRVAAVLVESVQKFRRIAADLSNDDALGQEYLRMVRNGVIAAQYLLPWQDPSDDALLLAPAYTFLLANRPVDYQFWLNVGGQGWWERLYQPLTHPYVLSRRWPGGRVWTDVEETQLRQQTLEHLVLGLLRRCRRGVYLGLSTYSEQGFEQEGALLRIVQRTLRQLQAS
jgi:hypothetical protein